MVIHFDTVLRYIRERLSRMFSRKWSFTRYHSQHVKRNRQCAPITTTFSRSRLRESKPLPLKPTLHKPPFRSVRFSRVHLPVLLYVYLPACVVALAFAILGTIFAPIYRSAIYGCRYLCTDVGAIVRKILVGKYLKRYLSQLDISQENRLYFEKYD